MATNWLGVYETESRLLAAPPPCLATDATLHSRPLPPSMTSTHAEIVILSSSGPNIHPDSSGNLYHPSMLDSPALPCHQSNSCQP